MDSSKGPTGKSRTSGTSLEKSIPPAGSLPCSSPEIKRAQASSAARVNLGLQGAPAARGDRAWTAAVPPPGRRARVPLPTRLSTRPADSSSR